MLSLNKANWRKLLDVEEKLRAYVHGEGCHDVYACPRDHEHKLTLATSLAWSIADRLLTILETRSEIAMEDFLKETLMLYATFKRHKDEYPELAELMKEIYRSCKQKD